MYSCLKELPGGRLKHLATIGRCIQGKPVEHESEFL